jgi:lactate dehydrogenase-like 2-hydroxyacid dehydrogenase
MTPQILQLTPIYGSAQGQLEQLGTVHKLWEADEPARRDALLDAVAPHARIAVTSGFKGIDRATIERLPHLRLIACFGVGVDAVDVACAHERGVQVTNTPDVLTEEVADLAIGLLLATARRIAYGDRYVRAGRWLQGAMPLTTRVHGKRLGIIGMGRIGQAIALRAQAFGLSIAWQGPNPKPRVPYRYEPDLVALAGAVDFLIAACPGGAATRGIVNRAVLDALGPHGILVNIARGSVVDEPALVEALTSGRLGGAGLDVFADEPRVPAGLLALDQVVLQPHQASATHETRTAMGQLVVDNVAAFLAGRPLLTVVAG